jgi:hypothetical protein
MRTARLPLPQPRFATAEARQFKVMLLPEELAAAKADAGHVAREPALDPDQSDRQLRQPQGVLVCGEAQLRFALRQHAQPVFCQRFER